MKPCSQHRKHIAWLAVSVLDARQERKLRAHLESCKGCRAYLEELSCVAEKISAAEISSEIRTSESFHRKLIGRLRVEEQASTWETLAAYFRATFLNWQVALPAIGAAALVLAGLFVAIRPPTASSPTQSSVQAIPAQTVKTELAPTLSNYQMIANRSLEKFDEVLTREGNRNPSPSQIYTASTLSLVNLPD